MRKKIAVFLFDGFSDWEISYFAPEINKSELFDLVYFSTNGDRVTSMGGLNVTPTVSLGELDGGSVDLLVVPGGTAWERGENGEITDLVNKCFENGKPIAAICAATSFLGQLGLLDNLNTRVMTWAISRPLLLNIMEKDITNRRCLFLTAM